MSAPEKREFVNLILVCLFFSMGLVMGMILEHETDKAEISFSLLPCD